MVRTYCDNNCYSVLSDHSIPYERKMPFASLLCWVYLSTERDSLVSVGKLIDSQSFWGHIEECGLMINAMNQAIQKCDKDQIRTHVKLLLTQFTSIPVSMQQCTLF